MYKYQYNVNGNEIIIETKKKKKINMSIVNLQNQIPICIHYSSWYMRAAQFVEFLTRYR